MNKFAGFDISKVFVGICFLLILHWLFFSRHKFDVFPKVYNYFILYIIIHTIVVYAVFVPEEFSFGYLGEKTARCEGFTIKEETRSIEVFRMFLLVFFAYAVASYMKTKKRLIIFAFAYGLGMFFTSVFGSFYITGPGGEEAQFAGGFTNPNALGPFALTAVWLNLFVVFMPKQKAWIRITAILLVLTALVAILRSISRGTMLALCVGIMCMVFFMPSVKRKLQLIIFACVLSVGIFLAMSDSLTRDIYARFNRDRVKEKGGSYRLAVWSEYLSHYPKYVLMGVGKRRSKTVIEDSAPQILKERGTHSTYLETLVEFGILGFLLFMAVLRRIWRNTSKTLLTAKRSAADAVMLGLLASWITIFMTTDSYNSRSFWISIAVLAAYSFWLKGTKTVTLTSPRNK